MRDARPGSEPEASRTGLPASELRLLSYSIGPGLELVLSAAPALGPLIRDDVDPDRLPFWAVVWESAPALGRWMAERGGWTGVPVLELGCGVGLAGIVAASFGARVTQTDLFPEAVALARRNARSSGCEGIRHVAADWRAWPLLGRWPVVIASDVAYERSCHGPLLEVLETVLTPDGTAYLADPSRPMSLDFFARAEREGWNVRMEPAPGGSAEVWIYTLCRCP